MKKSILLIIFLIAFQINFFGQKSPKNEISNPENHPDFQAILQLEKQINSNSKIEKFDKIYDSSGYEICVYRDELNKICKYSKAYWRAYAPDYNREMQFIEEYYFINDAVHEKITENPNQKSQKIKWIFNTDEKINSEIQNLYTIKLKWEVNKNPATNKYDIELYESRNNEVYSIGSLDSDTELLITTNTSVKSKRNSILTISKVDAEFEEGFTIFRENNNLNVYYFFMGNKMESVLKEIKSIPISQNDIVDVII